MSWQGIFERSNGEVGGRGAGSMFLAPAARRVVSFYEKALPGLFGVTRYPASAAIHLGFWDGKTRTRREAALNDTHALAAEVGQSASVGNRIRPCACGTWNGTSKLDFQAASRPLLNIRDALRLDGRGWFGKRKERKEALDRLLVAFDPDVFRAQRVCKEKIPVDQRGQRFGVGLDDRVGVLGASANDLKASVSNLGPETILPKPQLVSSVEPFRGFRIEHRPEGEDEGVHTNRSAFEFRRGANTPAPKPVDHRLKLHSPLGQLVDFGSCRRRELSPAHYPGLLKPTQALGQYVRAYARQSRPQIREALRSQQQLAHHQERPALPYQIEGVSRSTAVVVSAPLRCAWGSPGDHTQESSMGIQFRDIIASLQNSIVVFTNYRPYASHRRWQPNGRRRSL